MLELTLEPTPYKSIANYNAGQSTVVEWEDVVRLIYIQNETGDDVWVHCTAASVSANTWQFLLKDHDSVTLPALRTASICVGGVAAGVVVDGAGKNLSVQGFGQYE